MATSANKNFGFKTTLEDANLIRRAIQGEMDRNQAIAAERGLDQITRQEAAGRALEYERILRMEF